VTRFLCADSSLRDFSNELPVLACQTLIRATRRSIVQLTVSLIALAYSAGCGVSNPPTPPGSEINTSVHATHKRGHRLSQNGVDVHPSEVGAHVSSSVLGAGMAVWFDITQPGMAKSFVSAGMTTTRWPGGHSADHYHWQTNSYGTGSCSSGYNVGKPNPNATFDNFMADIASPAHLDVAITVNYGSNPQCTGGADPAEAAAWVAYANVTKAYNLTWWTVGNEQYTQDSLDLRSQPHDPSQYAQVVSQDYYQQMKAASPIPINVCVDASGVKAWDATVFSQAKFDCVEVHYYPQKGTKVDDAFLLSNGAPDMTKRINTIRGELAAAGRPATPIYVAEVGSATAPGDKQEMSITQALYAGQVIGEMLNDGIARATWHSGYDPCNTPSKGGDFSKTLYGWQNFGGAMIFSDGTLRDGCSKVDVPLGTLMPTAVAFEVASHFVRNGEHMLGVSVVGMPNVRAYATTYNGGYALMLFNLSQTSSQNVPVTIDGKTSGSGRLVWRYGKPRYDASKNNVWMGPSYSTLSGWQNSFTLELTPWSITVLQTT
jgi:hypothetical protein